MYAYVDRKREEKCLDICTYIYTDTVIDIDRFWYKIQ